MGEPDDAVRGQEKGNLAEASVELTLERALSLAFFKEGSACGKELNRIVAVEARLWK
jgi:hypothetical protein